MVKNKSYWIKRQAQWIKNQDHDDTTFSKKLKKHYQKTAKEIEKDIATYYQKYGKDNIIEFRTMMQSLDKVDRDLLFQSMDEFAEKYPQYADLMPVRESVYKLNRLQGLNYSTQMQLLELGVYEQMEMEKYLEGVYDTHYSNMAKELGLGSNFLSVDSQTIRNTIFTKWVNGENFSDRIWKNKNKLLNHLTTKYRDGLARGDNYNKLTKDIVERFSVGANDAKRLVWTESSFVLNQAHAQPYIDTGVVEYELNAIRDSRTSDICKHMDGKVFRFDEMKVGVNFPPFHSYCRTTYTGKDLDELIGEGIEEDNTTKNELTLEGISENLKNNEDILKRDEIEKSLKNELDTLYGDIMFGKNTEGEIAAMKKEYRTLHGRLWDMRSQNYYENAKSVKNELGKYREMGIGNIEMKGHLNLRSKASKTILEAYDYYPTDWVKRSVEYGKIKGKTVKRGFYRHSEAKESILALSGGGSSSFRTALHELGHRQEYINSDILKAEKVFYESRTKGEDLKRLRDVTKNNAYRASEVTRVDNFINPYMGKEYSDNRAYELLTMGIDTLYTRPAELMKDPEMFDWIVKILLTK